MTARRWWLGMLVPVMIAEGGCRADSRSASTDTAAPRGDAAPARQWVATPRGIGPVRAGMTAAEARAALGGTLAQPGTVSCDHVALTGAPGRVLAMLVDGRVARVEVKDSAVPTDRGARVGDSEARVDSLYGGRLRREPHKYTDGHYLVVVPDAAADSTFRLIFETDGAKVIEYRAGLLPAVGWVEGCS